jgi:di/tricarboxylate transporter
MGHAPGSRGQIALVITAATSTLLPTYTFLTANMPTIIHYGALETLYGLHPSYADYFVQQLPVNLVRFVLILALLLPLARTMPVSDSVAPQTRVDPMSPVQKRLAALLCLSILLWASDTWHGISPAWVALAVATVVLLPASGLLNKDAMKTSIDLSPAFFLAGVFAISAVVAHIGLNTDLADAILPRLHLGEGSQFRDLYAIVGFSTAFSHLTTAPAAPVVLAPLAMPMAEAAGWPVSTVAMAQIIGISTPLLPYQAPPLIIGLALSGIPSGMLTRVCLGIGLGVFVIGLPITYLWWQLIGAL